METYVYKKSLLPTLLIHILFAIGFISVYLYLDYNLILIALVIQTFLIVRSLKNRIVIKDNCIRYEKLFGSTVVPLQEVSDILQVEDISYTGNGTMKELNFQVYGQEGESHKVFFIAPMTIVPKSKRKEFKEVIHKINPDIRVDLKKAYH